MFKSITKAAAIKRFNEGQSIVLCPSRLLPGGEWNPQFTLGPASITEWKEKAANYGPDSTLWKGDVNKTAWELFYNNWAYYNTDEGKPGGMGKTAKYYIESDDKPAAPVIFPDNRFEGLKKLHDEHGCLPNTTHTPAFRRFKTMRYYIRDKINKRDVGSVCGNCATLFYEKPDEWSDEVFFFETYEEEYSLTCEHCGKDINPAMK